MQTTVLDIREMNDVLDDLPQLRSKQLEQLRQSLKSEGMKSGIVVCTVGEVPGKYFIVDGHQRYWEARNHGIPLKVDTQRTMHFDTFKAAHLWIYKMHAAKRNLSAEQFNYLLACYYFCFCSNESPIAANQDADGVLDQIDPDIAAEIVAGEFGVSPMRVKRAAAKVELISDLGFEFAIMDGRVRSVSKRTLEEFVKAKEADGESESCVVLEAIFEAEENGGKLLPPGTCVDADLEDDKVDDEDHKDPDAERALEERTKMITWLICQAREEWDGCYVERLERNVAKAFASLPESRLTERDWRFTARSG